MEIIEILRNASKRIYENVKDLILHHINRVLNKGSVQYKKNTIHVSANLRLFLIRLRNLNNNCLKDLITKMTMK